MAVTENSYTGNGSTTNYSFTFPYLKSTDIEVQVDATVQATSTWSLANATTVQFNSAPANNSKIKILRKTNVDNLTATFYAGSAIKSEDLNDNFTQNLYSTQETSNRAFETTGGTLTGDLTLGEDVTLTFEGATDNAHETTLTVVDPTADRTITLPNVTGTVVTTGDTATVTATMLAANSVDSSELVDGSVDLSHMSVNSVSTDQYVDNSIDHVHLKADVIDGDNIQDDVINSEHLVAGSIDTEHYSNNSIQHVHLQADVIDGDNIQDDVINSEHIAAGAVDLEHMSANSVDSDQYVDGSIDLAHMSANSVDSDQYVDGSIDTAHLGDNQVTTAKIADANITTAKLAGDAVTGAKIADDAIDSEHYTDGSIDTAHIATQAITGAKIADDAVGTAEIADNSITNALMADDAINSAEIADGAIDTVHIADSQVTTAKIAADAITDAKIADDAVTTDHIADAELTTLAGMQSGTASILAGGTALAATLTEINTICDGKGVETTITNDDTKYPTSGAVVDYVAAQIAPLGGLEVIATEVAFPNTQPASGVVISISDAGGVVFNGSGVSTTGRTVGNSTVTINGAPSSLYSETLAAGVGLMVSSTGSSQTYNYHKILGKEDDIKQLSDDINDFNARYRVNAGEPGSNNDEGDLVYDTSANKMKVYDGSSWGEVTSTGDFKFLVPVDAGTTTAATWDGSDTSFDLKEGTNSGSAAAITSVYQLMISVNGVIQKPNTGSWSGSGEGFYLTDSDTIRFATAPPSGSSVFVIQFGSALSPTTPADNTVATAKIQNLAVTTAKIAADAVTGAKIADDTIDSEHIAAGAVDLEHMSSESVDEDNLKISNAGSNGQYLQKQSGNTGGLTWADATSVGGATGVDFNDSVSARFGTGNDFKIVHGGTNTHLDNNTGNLVIRNNVAADVGGDIHIMPHDDEYGIIIEHDGPVSLLHDNVTTFKTTTNGAKITAGEGNNTELFFDADEGDDNADKWKFVAFNSPASTFDLYNYTAGSWEKNISCVGDGTVELYHNNAKKLETTSGGISVTGGINLSTNLSLLDDSEIKVGTGDDLKIFHQSSYPRNVIETSGADFVILTSDHDGTAEKALGIARNGGVELYHDNVKKLETTSVGVTVTGAGNRALKVNCTHSSGGEILSLDNGVNNHYGGLVVSGGEIDRECRIEAAYGDSLLTFWTNNSEHFRIANNGDLTATDTSIGSNSDSRLKKNIANYTYDLAKFKQFQPKTFDWINKEAHGNKTGQRGFIAQDLESIDDKLVGSIELDPEHLDKDLVGSDRIAKTAKLGENDAMYISVINQLITKIETLETKVAALEAG